MARFLLGALALVSLQAPPTSALIAGSITAKRDVLGSIEGVVRDRQGRFVSGYSVSALNTYFHRGSLSTRTDSKGYFLILGVPNGQYWVFAGNEAKGFPEMIGNFWKNGDLPVFEVTGGRVQANIRLGNPLGKLMGVARDIQTGRRIGNMRLELFVTKEPGRRYWTLAKEDGTFLIPVPDEEITVIARADDDQPMRSAGVAQLSGIRVPLGKTKNIRIDLVSVPQK